ncbi:hypothetical protein OIU77_020271 [Salix suchowensis]|uniref:tRNA pseudouridine(55) synthase n=1 Tax=Salix suchowensis TaxID=1278906 RepID=A0ABQ9CNP6_9ROSI|nr:hypothetical protein OIU77_020271 [Salix suchowensis]
MSSEIEEAQDSNGTDAAQIISRTNDHSVTLGDDEIRHLNDAVCSLPSHAVKDLHSAGVCIRCIFRLFGIHDHAYFRSTLSPSVMCNILGEGDSSSSESNESELKPEVCRICLGILQFTYRDEKEMLVKRKNGDELAASIAELLRQEGHQIDGFSLEVSIPPIIFENEQAVRLYMKKKYGSEIWFQDRFSECISTKDALKFAIVNPLETILDVKSGPSSVRVRLTYTETKPSIKPSKSVDRNGGLKRRKTETNNGLDTVHVELVGNGTGCCNLSLGQGSPSSGRSSTGLAELESSECFNFPLERVNEPCHLVFVYYRAPMYFGGRYLKFSRNVSQTRWIIDDERMGEASIEEIIGGNILPMCQGESYKFHAAGREDIDVRMLGSGRPFLVEVQNARKVPSEALIKEIETRMNNLEGKLVGVKNLSLVTSHSWDLMREGEAEKQKQYCALVWISRPLEDEDLQCIASHKDLQILQRTPVRVLHRRSPLERGKMIHWMKTEQITGSSQYFLLHLCTQAGTYIKEFVHGDLGRTHPSIGSILRCRAEILQLDVTDVKMDCFLAE